MYITNHTSVTNWSAYGFSEYLLIANPGKEVYEKVVIVKEGFYYKYREKIAIKTGPHITIGTFLGRTEMEEVLSYSIQAICNLFRASTVTLDNYGGFAPNTIFLKVQNHEPFKRLTKALKAVDGLLQAHNCPPIKLTNHPHMSIARRLQEHIYYTALREYKQRIFFESFTMRQLVLIKRPHQYHKCQNVNTFNLLPRLKPQGPASFQLKLNL